MRWNCGASTSVSPATGGIDWSATLRAALRFTEGGLVVYGVPGYLDDPLLWKQPELPGFGAYEDDVGMATLTYTEHNAPGDYYRFGPQAVRQVFLAGMSDPRITAVMRPPRIVGWGRKPAR